MKYILVSMILVLFAYLLCLPQPCRSSKLHLPFDEKVLQANISSDPVVCSDESLPLPKKDQILHVVFCNFHHSDSFKKKILGFALLCCIGCDDKSELESNQERFWLQIREIYYFDDFHKTTPLYVVKEDKNEKAIGLEKPALHQLVFEKNQVFEVARKMLTAIGSIAPTCPCNVPAFAASLHLWRQAHLKQTNFLVEGKETSQCYRGSGHYLLTKREISSPGCHLRAKTLWNTNQVDDFSILCNAKISLEGEVESSTVLFDCVDEDTHLDQYLINSGLISRNSEKKMLYYRAE